jgi:UDP-N-acetylmuramate dehydrogenase
LADPTVIPQAQVPLSQFSTLGVGGPARWFLKAEHVDDVRGAHAWSREMALPLFVLGGGSNLVISDEGFSGLIVQVALEGTEVSRDGRDTVVRAAAGESWDGVVAATVARGLAGVECLSGIPGTVGGTPIQNVGAYGQEIADTIESVTVFDTETAELLALQPDQCRFSYRMSRFKQEDAGRFIVCDISLRLRPGRPAPDYPDVITHLEQAGIGSPTVADVREAVLAIRRRKGMVVDADDADTKSVGSFFMNPVVTEDVRERLGSDTGRAVPGFALSGGRVKIPAAWLIEQAGFHKGHADGAAAISTKHPLAIVNRGGATARDVLRLATRIKRQVLDQFGVCLRPEPVFVGFTSDPDVEYLQKRDTVQSTV